MRETFTSEEALGENPVEAQTMPQIDARPLNRAEMSNASDEQLVYYAQEGNQGAIEILYDRHRNKINSIAQKYFIRKEESSDLEGIANQSFMEAIEKYSPEKAGEGGFWPYALLHIKSGIFAEIRASRRQQRDPAAAGLTEIHSDELISNVADKKSHEEFDAVLEPKDPIEMVVRNGTRDDLTKLGLTDLEANVFILRRQGISYLEIASKFGRGRKSIDNAMQRAIDKFHNIILQRDNPAAPAPPPPPPPPVDPTKIPSRGLPPSDLLDKLMLTPDQLRVAGLRNQGDNNNQIAEKLNMTLEQVLGHSNRIRAKWRHYLES